MGKTHLPVALTLLGLLALPLGAQTLSDRLDHLQARRDAEARQAQRQRQAAHPSRRLAHRVFQEVRFDRVPFQRTIRWFQEEAGIPIVVNWRALEQRGIDPDHPVTLSVQSIPAETLLRLVMRQAARPGRDLILERTRWYLQILTREEARRMTVTRLYPIEDLVMRIPMFDQAPTFDLESVLEQGDGAARAGSQSIFGDPPDRSDPAPSRRERGERIARVIRHVIEPGIWAAHGGEHASIRYLDGRLFVRAPRYVQRQIGGRPAGIVSAPPRPAETRPSREAGS